MSEGRTPIPGPVQRQIRQRCGFGCVLCGAPLYDYHHMTPYNELQQHDAEEITLLCDKHHKEASNGLLPAEQILQANGNPFNVQHKVSSPYGLHFQGSQFQCVIGGNRFSGGLRNQEGIVVMIPLSVDDIDLVWFCIDPSGNLFLNANIFDENNLPLLRLVGNRLAYRTDAWDIEFKGRLLTVREAARKISFEIEFSPPGQIIIHRARLLCNGVEILVRKSHIFVVNSSALLDGCTAHGVPIGLQIGRNDRGLGGGFSGGSELVCRYNMPATEVRRREREAIRQAKKMMDAFRIDRNGANLT